MNTAIQRKLYAIPITVTLSDGKNQTVQSDEIIVLALDAENAASIAKEWFNSAKPWKIDSNDSRRVSGSFEQPMELSSFKGYGIGKKLHVWKFTAAY